MADKEKKNLKEEGEDSEKGNCPLSREGWIMFLSDEIYRKENVNKDYFIPISALVVTVALGLLYFLEVTGTSMKKNLVIFILSLIWVIWVFLFGFSIFVVCTFVIYRKWAIPNRLENLRREVIIGTDASDTPNKICRQWEEIDKMRSTNKCLFVAVVFAVVVFLLWAIIFIGF